MGEFVVPFADAYGTGFPPKAGKDGPVGASGAGRLMADLLIASRVASDGPGGLARYERGLALAFERFTGAAPLLCASQGPNPHSGVSLLNSMVREPRSLWMSLASRRVLHPFLESLIRDAHRKALRTLIPAKPRIVHFIGTGWDFSGFAMADFARRTGARFTIWPAIHPGQWGGKEPDE